MDTQYFNSPQNDTDEQYEVFDLDIPDSRLVQMVSKSLDESISYWNQWPYSLEQCDRSNLRYWLGQQMLDTYQAPDGSQMPNMGNRLMTSSRAVLAYVNARVAQPEVAPSTSDAGSKQFALDSRSAMYQHGVNHKLKRKAKKATQNLVIQKRGFLKLRFDPTCGPYGDIEVDHVNPEDIVVDKWAAFGVEPQRIWHRQRCSIEELTMKFPEKKEQIHAAFEIGRGVYSQVSRKVTYWECWFTFFDEGKRKEGVAWYLPKGKIILGKMLNPNWIYTGDDQQDKIINYTSYPIKPFVVFNYLNSGKSFIDETSLFEQAKPLQDLYNKRSKQIMDNNDNMSGRVIADGNAMQESDADKFFKKSNKAILLIKPTQGQSVSNSVYHVQHNPLPPASTDEKYDTRNEIDQSMGTPNIFRGEQSKNNTLGQDERLIEQAGALQDDLAAAVDEAMDDYYQKLFQMFKVYYTEDHWFQVRGEDGKYDFVVMNSDTMDTDVRVSVEGGSTLPANKREMRQIIVDAANADRIDDLSFWEGLVYGKLPEPEVIVERLQKQLNDPASFMQDVEREMFNREANSDIAVLIAGKEPPERDEYGQAYLEYFNKFIMGNKFVLMPPDAQERIKTHLASVGMLAARTSNLQATQQDDATQAGMTEQDVAMMEQ